MDKKAKYVYTGNWRHSVITAAQNVLCSDGHRRVVTDLRDGDKRLGRVIAKDKSISGHIVEYGGDLLFVADPNGKNAGLLPDIPVEEYSEK